MMEASGSGIRISKGGETVEEVETLSKLPLHHVTTFCQGCGKTMDWLG